jgi:hypothetical protein
MAQDFQYDPGTSNGYTKAPFDLLSTETGLSALANGAAVTSSVGGAASNGIFSQSDTGGAVLTEISMAAGGSFTPNAGAYLLGWFLRSKDGGTTFETMAATPSSTVQALPRPADFSIPLDNAALASGNQKWAMGTPRLPSGSFKVVLQNMAGVTVNISHITCEPFKIQAA